MLYIFDRLKKLFWKRHALAHCCCICVLLPLEIGFGAYTTFLGNSVYIQLTPEEH